MSTGFAPDLPPRRPPASAGQRFRDTLLRLALCLATAVVVSATAYLCAWLTFGGYVTSFNRGSTRHWLRSLTEDIALYREKTGSLPVRLSDLNAMRPPNVGVDEEGRPIDDWGRPLHYEVAGDSYDLYSLGRDGLPGGYGLDADLHAGRTDPQAERLTFWQFTTEAYTGGIKPVCLAAGILAFPICLVRSRPEAGTRPTLRSILMKNAVTALFAVGAAFVITFLHLPSGH